MSFFFGKGLENIFSLSEKSTGILSLFSFFIIHLSQDWLHHHRQPGRPREILEEEGGRGNRVCETLSKSSGYEVDSVWSAEPLPGFQLTLFNNYWFSFFVVCSCDREHRGERWGSSFLLCGRRSGHEGLWCGQLWHDQHAEAGVSLSAVCRTPQILVCLLYYLSTNS